VSPRPHLAFNLRPRCLSTLTDAFQLHPDMRSILPDDARAPRCEGLIHISELSWNRVSHPRDVVKVGDVVSVKVLETIAASGNGGDGGGNGGGGETKSEVRLLPIRPRSRVDRRSLRTFHVVTLHPRFPFNV